MVADELIELFGYSFGDIIADVFAFIGIGALLTCLIGFICWCVMLVLGLFGLVCWGRDAKVMVFEFLVLESLLMVSWFVQSMRLMRCIMAPSPILISQIQNHQNHAIRHASNGATGARKTG